MLIGILGFVSLFISKTKHYRFDNITYLFAIAAIVLGVGGIEMHDPINGVVLSNRLWLGFGPFVLVLLVLVAFVAWQIWQWKNINRLWKTLLLLFSLVSVSLASLSFWQDSESIIDPDHSEYVLNEVMAIRAGNWPFENFIPQYQTVYTFIAAMLNSLSTDSFDDACCNFGIHTYWCFVGASNPSF
jgi:hypothetical protein